MSEDDEWQVIHYLLGNLVTRQNEFVQYQHGLMTDDDWKSREGIIRLTLAFPWARHWWREVPKDTFNAQFVERVDRIIDAAPLDLTERLDHMREHRA